MAEIKLAGIFSSNMVLQRNINAPVWGTAKPGEKIIAEIGTFQTEAVAGKDGKWMLYLPVFEAGGPYSLKIKGENEIELTNVMFGDVWFASGQSNMEWSLENALNGKEEVAKANYKDIRLFHVPKRPAQSPKEDLEGGEWKACSPQTVGGFSAVAYFFGRDLYDQYKVPIGLIDCSWGGTVAEAWTSAQMLKTLNDFKPYFESEGKQNWENDIAANNERDAKRTKILEGSFNALNLGIDKSSYSTNDWRVIMLPTFDEKLDNRVTWLRKVVDVPKDYKNLDLKIDLGRIEYQSDIYFNGERLGTFYSPDFVVATVPAKLVKSGDNVVTIRLSNRWGDPGFSGPESRMKLYASSGAVIADLSGAWKYHTGLEPAVPEVKQYHNWPASLFNGMVNPVIPYGIKGIIWYQGESNDTRAYQYRSLFKALITDWRLQWKLGYLPFLYVQLPNYLDVMDLPGEAAWAELREAQLMALDLPVTGMAVTIDLGEALNLHPKDKLEVGKRLALSARKVAYGENIVHSGPVYKSMEIKGAEIQLSFDYVGGGLMAKGGNKLEGFAIAGKDKKFYWAEAQIVGGKVFVTSEKVKEPVAVRYAWASNPVCNLYNKQGLPASPFRTDDWDGITKGVK